MLTEALQRNAKHEARLSNISGLCSVQPRPNLIQDSSPATADQNDIIICVEMVSMTTGLWDRETFVDKLRAIGLRAYHDKHPFHIAMNEGQLSPEALRGWVANRFYYQRNIPIKDAAILANCPVREVRRAWIHRILDHDRPGLQSPARPPQPWRRRMSSPENPSACAGDSARSRKRRRDRSVAAPR